MSVFETVAATVAVVVVVGFCCFAYWDIVRLGREMQAAEVGAGGVPVPRRVRGMTDGTACADTFPREWVVACSRPFDQETL